MNIHNINNLKSIGSESISKSMQIGSIPAIRISKCYKIKFRNDYQNINILIHFSSLRDINILIMIVLDSYQKLFQICISFSNDTQTAKHAVQFLVTVAKRKRSKTSVPCSLLKRFYQRTARRGQTSADISRQLRMVCCNWPRCSCATFDRFQPFVHYQLLVQFWPLQQRWAMMAIANICKSGKVDDICFNHYIYIC